MPLVHNQISMHNKEIAHYSLCCSSLFEKTNIKNACKLRKSVQLCKFDDYVLNKPREHQFM